MKLKSHFKFNKQERSGIFFLLLIIVALQIGYYVFRSFPKDASSNFFSSDIEIQDKVDLLKENALVKDSVNIYPFNPNFITDYKGYTLGMSAEEIDRLHAFRAKEKYVNSQEDFQKVTHVSDSLLSTFSSHFKFPEWTKNRDNIQKTLVDNSLKQNNKKQLATSAKSQDLNAATAEDLMAINGIGQVLSKRIIKYRDRLGGFLIEEQLYEVYFLEPEVAERVLAKFKLFNKPVVKKININEATAYEISSLVYIKYPLAKKIVEFREENGSVSSLNELKNIEGFPSDKIGRIALYLSL